MGTFVNCSLACDDVQKTYEAYLARGVEFTQAPTVQPWGTFAKFKDADGNEFVLSGK